MSAKLDAEAIRRVLRGRPRAQLRLDGFRESAVLVPLVVEEPLPDRLLLTVRCADLTTHAGQVAFPGGKRDPDDPTLEATAMREAAEELGIPPESVEVLGLLDDVPTPTGYVITPVVARVAGPLALTPSAAEVDAVLACEVAALPQVYQHNGTRTFLGYTYELHEYHWGTHRIWGATARILHQLLDVIRSGRRQLASE